MYDLIIIDGLNIAHRFKWVHRNFTDKHGRFTGIYYGVLNYVRGLIKKYNRRDNIIFVWDSPDLKKKVISSNYKADRKKHEDSFYYQIDNLKEMLSLYGIKQYYAIGYEADDIAAKIVKDNSRSKILLISNDTDWWQLSSSNVDVKKGSDILRKNDILEITKLNKIHKYIMYLSIIGTHNNVQGIKGIRKNDVIQILNMVNNFTELKNLKCEDSKLNKTLQKIFDNKELIKSNFYLVSFIIPMSNEVESIKTEYDLERLFGLCDEYNMAGLMKYIKNDLENEDL